VCGELHIGGAGLASGYLNRPELMNERFVPNPFSADPEARLYRTGDMVRYLADGTIEFLGRVDQQVKIRGFRVELGEIETVLARHPKVQEAIVLDQEDHAGDKYLVAYVIPRRTQSASGDSATEGTHLTFSSATVAESRDFIRQHLPEYMVPTAFAVLDAWPLTPSGKVDRRALAAVETISVHDATFVPPRNDIEQHLIDIWTSVLNIDQIGIYDNFFDLGGHSLLATQLITRIEERFHIDIPLRLIFETPNAAELAIAIAQLQANQVDEHEMDRLFAEIEQLSDDEVRHLLTI
jgi:acyl carrier protein